MTRRIVPPWAPAQVVMLNERQARGEFHPYTCPHRGQDHADLNGPHDVLVATVRGWVCPFCDFIQAWAWGCPNLANCEVAR